MTQYEKSATNKQSGCHSCSGLEYSVTLGIVLITIGVLLLAIQMGWVDPGLLWKFWPVALILAGVFELKSRWREQK